METLDKEDFHGLMRLADYRLNRAFNRRHHEWIVTVSVWTLFAAAIAHPLHGQSNNISKPVTPILVTVMVFVLAVTHIFGWIRAHWVTSTTDLRMAFWFAEHAEEKLCLNGSPNPKERPPRKMPRCKKWLCFLCDPTCLAQVVTTIVLMAGVIFRAWWS
jgi:hypothetical protein